jgi:Zn-dependent protease/CBS domain-containing protein
VLNDSLRLGTLRGIRIGVHWSVLFVAWLLAWGLATRLLPAAAPGATTLAYWAAGIGVAVLFFGSLLAHELAHAVLAQRAGVRVEGITLWLLGGVAKLDGEVATPGDELRIAASGPLTSAAFGLLFGAVAVGGAAVGAPALLAEAAGWLARVNLVIAVFNLLPGAPLDGGRIVRAIAWRFGRDRLRATLLAARLGRLLGFGLIGFGVLELVVGADLGGIWTVVIGLFMTTAAAAERDQEVARDALAGVRIREVMAPDPIVVPAGITVDVFVQGVLVAQRQTAALVVEAGGVPFGIAGVSEVAHLDSRARRDTRVRDIAVPHQSVPVVSPDEELLPALERTRTEVPGGSPYLLVLSEGRVVGLVSPSDLVRSLEARTLARGPGRRGEAPLAGR